ncbi:sensor domain-containing diguanylate cyclase [Niameybacter massiliensis]|uniref:sensor domain-containing diguanylate cyclase n=1 Tax=Niameybacter massiliensis TaxID=1658108 RepID=UPI0006B67375|nr:sensor domain-containing diguanylate cyclase [Niameybacter massiliensis]
MNKGLKEVELQLQRLKNDPEIIDFFIEWAYQNLRQDPEYVKYILEQALEVCRGEDYKIPMAECLYYLGWYYCDKSDYRKSVRLLLEANNLFIEMRHKRGMSKSYNALVPNYVELSMFDLAIENGIKSLDLAEELDDETFINTILLNTGFAYMSCEKYEEAAHLVKRVRIYEDHLSLDSKVSLYCIMTQIKLHENAFEEAYDYTEKIIEIADIRGFSNYYIEAENLRGLVAWRMKKYDASEEHFKKALLYGEGQACNNVIFTTYYSYGELLYECNKYEEAKRYIMGAIEIGKTLGLPYALIKGYKLLSKCYAEQEDYKEAYETSTICRNYEKEFFNLNTSLAFNQLNMRTLQVKATLYEQLYNKIEGVFRVGQRLTSNLDIKETFESIYRELTNLVDADAFGLALIDSEENNLNYEFFRLENNNYNLGAVCMYDETSLGVYALTHDVIVHINDADKESAKYVKHHRLIGERIGYDAQSIIYCPLTVENKKIGVVTAQSHNKNAYNERDINTLKLFATYAAIAIYNGQLFNQVNYLASYDGLTHVWNRREVFKLAEEVFKRVKNSQDKLCVIMLDVDYFKHINDAYGHLVGDKVLVKVAAISKEKIKDTDLMGRYGGEEFIIFLPHTTLEETLLRANMICEGIHNYKKKIPNTPPFRISASLGVYEFDGSEVSLDEGIKRADEALYQAKQQGKNQVVCYQETLKA